MWTKILLLVCIGMVGAFPGVILDARKTVRIANVPPPTRVEVVIDDPEPSYLPTVVNDPPPPPPPQTVIYTKSPPSAPVNSKYEGDISENIRNSQIFQRVDSNAGRIVGIVGDFVDAIGGLVIQGIRDIPDHIERIHQRPPLVKTKTVYVHQQPVQPVVYHNSKTKTISF